MADRQGDDSIAPRRRLGGPILPPPPPELVEEAAARRREQASAEAASARAAPVRPTKAQSEKVRPERTPDRRQDERDLVTPSSAGAPATVGSAGSGTPNRGAAGSRPRRTRKARLRLVRVDAWSVMKTAFLLSIALGIVLVVAVAIIWAVLGAAGVWDSVNSVVRQAVGTDNGSAFDIEHYLGTSRVLGFAMVVAVLDVILITAIATLGAFLYNLSAALLGGIEVVLAEDV